MDARQRWCCRSAVSLSFTTQYNGTSASVLAAFMASAAVLLKPVLMSPGTTHLCGFEIILRTSSVSNCDRWCGSRASTNIEHQALPPWFLRRPSRATFIIPWSPNFSLLCLSTHQRAHNVLRATAIHVSQTPSCQLTQSSCIAASSHWWSLQRMHSSQPPTDPAASRSAHRFCQTTSSRAPRPTCLSATCRMG